MFSVKKNAKKISIQATEGNTQQADHFLEVPFLRNHELAASPQNPQVLPTRL